MKKRFKKVIEENWIDNKSWKEDSVKNVVFEIIEKLDQGTLRVSEPLNPETWKVNEWIKKSILMFFWIQKMEVFKSVNLEFNDKIPLKGRYREKNIRVVPPAIARYGSYISSGVVLMPSYVNIGAYIGASTMIDTWATIGSCAQIGERVHISGGVGIGGVLEPIHKSPVIIEDDVFVGSRCIVVEGVHIKKEAVLGANVVLTSSTKIFDVTKSQSKLMKGIIPSRSVVIPGSYPKELPAAGIYHIPCALILGKRKESTDKKTSLNEALREYKVSL
ncbi:MAG TPA: 2,3,4,5-tetrahydropyridine-2,6-dicarboxylate N-succinyltransferase [Blattabacteriaceae bacterium]